MDELALGRSAAPIAPPTSDTPPARLTTLQILRLSSLWFGLQFFWVTQQLVIMPKYVEHFVGEEHKGSYYSLMKSAGALMVLLAQISVGFLSDHTHSKLGRRRPWIIYGLLCGIPSIILYVLSPTYWWALLAYLLIELTVNAASVAFQALLPDLVPPPQHNEAGAQMGLNHLAGNLLGVICYVGISFIFGSKTQHVLGDDKPAGVILVLLPAYIVLLLITGAIVVFGVDERGWLQNAREVLTGKLRELNPLPGTVVRYVATAASLPGTIVRHYAGLLRSVSPNLAWLAASRFAINFGYTTFLQFALYYSASNLDGAAWFSSLGLPAEKAQSLGEAGAVFAPMISSFIIGGLAGNLLSAGLARRFGRKRVIGGGVVWAGALFIPLIFTSSVWVAVGCGLLLGIGWGAFLAIDWSFACSLMPKASTGAYMGLWDATTLLPQVIAPIIAGPLRDAIFNPYADTLGVRGANALAHQWLFGMVIVYFAIGLFLLRPLREEQVA